ncbi:sensor histidine kinase [Glaciecola sp. 1036]|uniref:sensor histidine kinase n=1 Tax=Alteromonadaceae TaxID=72275 RepID=UPI003D0392CB
MTSLQLRSIRQLVFISFFISLVPLITLLLQSQRDFSKVSQITEQNTLFFVGIASDLQGLLNSGLDLQRLIKQYQVLKEPQLKAITESLILSFSKKLDSLCINVDEVGECSSLRAAVTTLNEFHSFNDSLVVDAYLARFDQSLENLQLDIGNFVDKKVIEQQAFLADMQKRQTWSTGGLVVLSLSFILFSAQLIAKPVRKLQTVIRAIASSSSSLPPKSVSGPEELMAVERDLFWLNDRLNQLEKVRVALLRHASHELKTPLASIKEGCAILSENLVGNLNEAQIEVLSLLDSSAERLNLLIERLLDYNALLQQAEPELDNLLIKPILDDCAKHHRLILQQNNQKLQISAKSSLTVLSDADLLRRIVDNLVSNAIAYGEQNSTIRIDAKSHGDDIWLTVKNQGKPIALALRGEIFEPFKRGGDKRNDKVMGAGLGLSIVADCARLVGGTINIEDVKDADVCFKVVLPRGK